MGTDLHSLLYLSRNTMTGTAAEVEAQVAQILASSRANNPMLGITGALLFSDGCFVQILEGDSHRVEATYNRILQDPRHADVSILQSTPIEARTFGHWSMAYAGQPNATLARLDLPGLLQDSRRIVTSEDDYSLVDVLREIVGQYDEAVAAE